MLLKIVTSANINYAYKNICFILYLGCSLYDDFIMDLTDNNPDLVDYHQEFFTKIFRNLTPDDILSKKKLMSMIAKYDPGCHELSEERLKKHPGSNFGFEVTTRILNTDIFCRFARDKLSEKYGVKFIQGTVNQATYTDRKIHSIGYYDENKQQQQLTNFDEYIFWGGIESINLGKLVGLRVPMYGIQGYSWNAYVDKEHMPDSSYMFIPENVVACRIGLNTTGMIRFTGYGDLIGNQSKLLDFRQKHIEEFAKSYVGEKFYDESKAKFWAGLRPVTPDDIPIIGKSSKFENLYWNTGHGGRGVSQATSSAHLLLSIMKDEKCHSCLNASDYSPERYNM